MDAPTHSITSPLTGADVDAKHASGTYRIDADGKADAAFELKQVVEVYGKVFKQVADIPTTQADIAEMISLRPGNGCIAGTPGSVTGDLHHKFRDGSPTFNSIPIHEINTANNYLQVWVKFAGDNEKYIAANDWVKFTPKSP